MMKKISLCVMFILLLLSSVTAFAASLPERTGIVTDPIGFFSTDEAKQMEEAMQGRAYEVLLLTSSGLSEEEGERLANEAYDGWKLEKNQLILVVTIDPNFVHLVYENAELESLVSRSDAQNAKGVIDRTFVPLASNGQVAEGVLAVSEYVNELQASPPAETQVPSPGQTQVDTPSSVHTPASAPAPTPRPVESGSPVSQAGSPAVVQNGNSVSLLTVLLVALGAIVCFLIVRQFVVMGRIKKRLEEAKQSHGDVNPALNKMMVSELFRELEVGLIEGQTRKKVAELEKTTLQLHQMWQQLSQQLEGQKVSFLPTARHGQEVTALYDEVARYVKQVEQSQAEIAEIERLSVEVRRSVEEAKERAKETTALIEQLARETSYPLPFMKKELEQANAILAKADRLDEFDYLQAEGPAVQVHQLFDGLKTSVEELREQVKLCAGFLPRIQKREDELREVVGREQLLLIDADPFAILQAARAEVTRLNTLVEAGHTAEAKACSSGIEESLQAASNAVNEMIRNRDHAKEAVRSIEELLAELNEFDAAYQQEFIRLQEHFAEVHLKEQGGRYSQIMKGREELKSLLIEIKAALESQVQQYKRAGERSDTALALLSQIKTWREQCLVYRQSLEEKKRSAVTRFETTKSRFYQSVSTFQQLRAKRETVSGMVADTHELVKRLEHLLDAKQTDMYQIEEKQETLESVVAKISHLVELLVREKEEAVRTLRQFHDDFTSRLHRYGRRINQSHYSSQFRRLQSDIEELIESGYFAEAVQQVAEGRSILGKMERDYRRALDEERRRNNHNSGGFGGGFGGGLGGGSGGGRSSGSSGWGGGGHSSGSSSWGGGGRSSGSSKW